MKIVSLIPSATEIIASLGLLNNLAGVSHECDYPKKVMTLPKLTKSNLKTKQTSLNIHKDIKKIIKLGLSIYEVKADLLKRINPDVIITQSQCSVCAVSFDDVTKSLNNWLGKKPKLIDLKPNNFSDIINDIKYVGIQLNVKNNSKILIKNINKEIKCVQKKLIGIKKKKILCIEWLNPLMVAGNWIPKLVSFAGGNSIIAKSGSHSPFILNEDIRGVEFEKVIFMPCGYDILKTKNEIKKKNYNFMNFFNGKEQIIVDGNKYFNRPGPDILESIKILCEIIHPNIFIPKPTLKRWIKYG